MEAAGVLKELPYKIEWSEFPAAAPLLEALNAEAIDTGIVGDAPFTFAVASGAPIRAILATRAEQGGLAVLVRPDSPVQTFADLKGKRIGTGRGSVGHQFVLAALEDAKLAKSDVTLSFLLPADAKAALTSGSLDAWSTWEPYTSQLVLSGEARIVRDGQGITPGLGFQAAHVEAIRSKRAETRGLRASSRQGAGVGVGEPGGLRRNLGEAHRPAQGDPAALVCRGEYPSGANRCRGCLSRAAHDRPIRPQRVDHEAHQGR